ncbi:hypothetical protein B0I35DRAFT_36365 [Stachybotrys elegans]|uniref:Life-span regulatory factor domain-containing protein n=1 Tax=Stachybotrys elegans TaxID=80388 RepID=A0A8K0T8G7_9HYPO|nr:hypothetical protein B0I35DRAFT_36365 [Stachybotrys elegans]
MHHQRRKSGNNSSTDVRKSVTASDMSKHKRPTMTRRHTPSSTQKLSRSHRERDSQAVDPWDDERESFPQYCMTCEKQFLSHDERHLYCSESCRRIDQNSQTQTPSGRSQSSIHYPFYSAGVPEPRDIVPRASPSRPGSMHFSQSPPTSPGTSAYPYPSSAVSALRSLNVRPPSPPSPTSASSTIWPFSRSAATSPSTSLTRPSAGFFSSTYDAAYAGTAYTYDVGSVGMERPLPSRQPGGYSRPKSIELVTPMVGR